MSSKLASGVPCSITSRRSELTGKRLTDPIGSEGCPREDTVGTPDLDAQDVRPLREIPANDSGRGRADLQLRSVDEAAPEDAARVLGETSLGIVEGLSAERVGQNGAEDEAAGGQQKRADDEEGAEERHGTRDALKRGFAGHGDCSNIGAEKARP